MRPDIAAACEDPVTSRLDMDRQATTIPFELSVGHSLAMRLQPKSAGSTRSGGQVPSAHCSRDEAIFVSA